jgi:hypothetical protein
MGHYIVRLVVRSAEGQTEHLGGGGASAAPSLKRL